MTSSVENKTFEINNLIHPNSRVWIYQSSRNFTDQEMAKLNALCTDFIGNWHTHGTGLQAFYQIFFNRFICLFVDENAMGASGCSIDSSVRFIQSLEKQFGISLMNRTEVAYMDSDRNVKIINLPDLKSAFKNGELTAETLVFNNLVGTKGEMETGWIVPASQSWHKRMMG